MRRRASLLPVGGDVTPPLLSPLLCSHLLCSSRAFSLLGEIITRHQAPGPDIHRSEKQRARVREAEKREITDATGKGKRPKPPSHASGPLSLLLTAESAVLWLTFHRWILGRSRMRACFDCSNSPTPPSSSSFTNRVADLRGISALCSSPSDQRSCKASETHRAPPRLSTTRDNPQEPLKILFL